MGKFKAKSRWRSPVRFESLRQWKICRSSDLNFSRFIIIIIFIHTFEPLKVCHEYHVMSMCSVYYEEWATVSLMSKYENMNASERVMFNVLIVACHLWRWSQHNSTLHTKQYQAINGCFVAAYMSSDHILFGLSLKFGDFWMTFEMNAFEDHSGTIKVWWLPFHLFQVMNSSVWSVNDNNIENRSDCLVALIDWLSMRNWAPSLPPPIPLFSIIPAISLCFIIPAMIENRGIEGGREGTPVKWDFQRQCGR